MCVDSLAGVTYLRYTVLSPNKGEAAVHCCDPALSVLVMLVSRNVLHVVSALQFIVFTIAKRANDVITQTNSANKTEWWERLSKFSQNNFKSENLAVIFLLCLSEHAYVV